MLSLPTEPTEPEPSGPYDWGNLASQTVAVQALLTGTQNGEGVGAEGWGTPEGFLGLTD